MKKNIYKKIILFLIIIVVFIIYLLKLKFIYVIINKIYIKNKKL